ncbi:hypothetical protein GCM10023063_16640 [Arthrobacter methylotrophus]|uniref:Holin n=1 Tax=Arthrobacter methylotrophus TaxID=121291 RepID=A0ABV5UNI3_9MICC
MIIDYWTRFGSSPLWVGISFAITMAMFTYLTAKIDWRMSVEGSHREYMASTIMKTLCLPLFGAFVFDVALDVFTQQWLGVLIDGYLAYTMHRDWQHIKDNDDWWKGRGTKLKKKLRSMFTSSSPATAGAGA